MGHSDFLLQLEQPLAAESFETHWVPASQAIPYDVLVVKVGSPEGPAWQLEFSFLPNMDSQLDGCPILQAFAALPESIKAGAESDLFRFLSRLNAKLPLGSFGLHGLGHGGEPPLLFFRHTAILPDISTAEGADTATRLIIQVTWMSSYLLDTFGERVMDVAAGRRTAANALEGHSQAGVV